jgi:hypothetical protein
MRYLMSLLGLVLLTAVAFAQQDTSQTTVIQDFKNGLQLNGSTTITGGAGAQDSAVNLPANSIGGAELSGIGLRVIYCGQADENGTIYLAPALAPLGGDTTASYAISSVACDALDNATEATADAPLLASTALKARGMYCKTSGTLGAGETLVFTLRSAAADTTPVLSCALAAGDTECRTLAGTTTNIAGGATTAVKAVQVSNNTDDDVWCMVDYMMQ